jgi:hypothetical protein
MIHKYSSWCCWLDRDEYENDKEIIVISE